MGDALRVQTRFSDAEEVMAVVGGALERGWLRLPLRVTNKEPFEIVLVAADGTQALCSHAEVVESAGAATWIRFLSAAPAAETEKGSRCMLAEVDIESNEPANEEQVAEPDEAVVPILPVIGRRAVLDVLPTVKMPALARASVPVLPPLLPPPPALAPTVTPPVDSISAALLAIEPTVEPEKLDLVELTSTPDKPIAFDTSDVTGEAKLFAETAVSGGELEAKVADAIADEKPVDVPTIDARGLGNELDTVAGEIRRDTDAMPPLDVREPADSTIPTPFAHPPTSQADIAASLAAAVGARREVGAAPTSERDLATTYVKPLEKPRSQRAVIMVSAAACIAAAIALVVVSTHGSNAHANAAPAPQVASADDHAPVQARVAETMPAERDVVDMPAAVDVPAAPAKPAVVDPTPIATAPARPEVVTAAPAEAQSACSIVIAASVEDAQVMIDGKARGEAPATINVPCGQPVAVAVHHPRYELYKSTITPTGQESMIAKLEREKTTVTVVSDPPGAVVALNGAPIGKTPLKTSVNRFEQATFNFSSTGYDTDWRRIMPKTGTSQVTIKLKLSDKGASRH